MVDEHLISMIFVKNLKVIPTEDAIISPMILVDKFL